MSKYIEGDNCDNSISIEELRKGIIGKTIDEIKDDLTICFTDGSSVSIEWWTSECGSLMLEFKE